jgi:GNAT superfamily N-acetyltransferase
MPTFEIDYRRDIALDPAQVARLYDDSGLRRPTRDLARIARMLDHSNLVFTAWNGGELVGIARSITDFGWCCYLADLAVARDVQRLGIGRELMRLTNEAIGPGCALVLNSAPEAVEYYPRNGMEKLDSAFIRRRTG